MNFQSWGLWQVVVFVVVVIVLVWAATKLLGAI